MGACIEVKEVSRIFKVPEKGKAGFVGSIESLFHRQYKEVHAVNKISFSVEKGEIRGLIGPNGAGKSTTIKMLSGILYPSSGTVDVLGYTPWLQRQEYVRKIGVVLGQKSQLVWDLPALDSYLLNKEIYKIPEEVYNENLSYFTKLLGIEEVVKRPVRQLSLGERMKCELVSALLHNPELMFLDEPTIGIDILAKETIINFIKEVNQKKGVSIILTTHDIGDIETLCEKVTVINHGDIVYDGALVNLKNIFTKKKVVNVQFEYQIKEEDLKDFNVIGFDGISAAIEIVLEESDMRQEMQKIIGKLPIKDITISNISVEEVIKELYK